MGIPQSKPHGQNRHIHWHHTFRNVHHRDIHGRGQCCIRICWIQGALFKDALVFTFLPPHAHHGPVTGLTTRNLGCLAIAHDSDEVPVYEKEQAGVLYNTAAVIDADGKYLGKYRKNHIPHTSGFWEKFFFKPGNLGYPVFETRYAKVGVYICYDRHFPDGARILGLNGAEIVYNPSATVAGLSQYLWKLEQPAHAAANGYFMGCINRVGQEKPWNLGKFYGSSYFVDPRGQIFAQASEDNDELLIADFDLDMIEEVRSTWQFFRDRRPETYGRLTEL